jgi:hypothetical protein
MNGSVRQILATPERLICARKQTVNNPRGVAMIAIRSSEIRGPAVAFAVSLILLFGIYFNTMLLHSRAIYYPDLWYGLPRIALIALSTSVLSLLIRKRGLVAHVVFGAVVGFGLAVAFVNIVIYLKS